jgi:hypothetical protein
MVNASKWTISSAEHELHFSQDFRIIIPVIVNKLRKVNISQRSIQIVLDTTNIGSESLNKLAKSINDIFNIVRIYGTSYGVS